MEVTQREIPNESHVQCWREAFIAKMYGRGKPYGKEEFDKLLRNYSVRRPRTPPTTTLTNAFFPCRPSQTLLVCASLMSSLQLIPMLK